MTVVSGHPASSKWWWIGAIRKMRRWNRRKLMTCMITETVSMTKSPPMMSSRSSRLSSRHSAARPAPMARDPVSPMMILAGAAFHHRNPMHAPASATATRERSIADAGST